MNIRKIGLSVAVIALVALAGGAVSAQETAPERQGKRLARQLIEFIAEETGLLPEDILAQLRGGLTLAEIITANGGSVETVVDAAVAEAAVRIDEAVAAGRITQERADRLLGNLEEVVTRAVNGELPLRPNRPHRIHRMLAGAVIRAAAEQTGLEPEAIREQLREGSSLADVLTANGVDTQVFIDGLVAQAETRINRAVENGRITRDRADRMLETLRERLTERINTPVPTSA